MRPPFPTYLVGRRKSPKDPKEILTLHTPPNASPVPFPIKRLHLFQPHIRRYNPISHILHAFSSRRDESVHLPSIERFIRVELSSEGFGNTVNVVQHLFRR